MKKLEIRKVRGFGGKLGRPFTETGINTVEQALNMSEDDLCRLHGEKETAIYIYKRLRGFCEEPIKEHSIESRTMVSSKTFVETSKLSDLRLVVDVLI